MAHPPYDFILKFTAEAQTTLILHGSAKARGEKFDNTPYGPTVDTLVGALLETEDLKEESLPAEWDMLCKAVPDKTDKLRLEVAGMRCNGKKFGVGLNGQTHKPGRYIVDVTLKGAKLVKERIYTEKDDNQKDGTEKDKPQL